MPAPARCARSCSRPTAPVVAGAAEPTPTRVLGPDSAELDAEELWLASGAAVLRRVVAELPDAKAIRSVAVASVGEAGVLLGADGQPLAPIIAWYDTRTTGELDWLLSHDRVRAAAPASPGCAPTRPSACSSCSGIEREQPELFAPRRGAG